MMGHLARLFIAWTRRRDRNPVRVVTFDDVHLFDRYAPFWPDEWRGHHRPPWWRPFNILVHHWRHGEGDAFHDHPRWSITLCLSGAIIERTPWAHRVLRPGSIVMRSRKAIHAFELPNAGAETWTVFVVGRRNHEQNKYVVTPQRGWGRGLPPDDGGAA